MGFRRCLEDGGRTGRLPQSRPRICQRDTKSQGGATSEVSAAATQVNAKRVSILLLYEVPLGSCSIGTGCGGVFSDDGLELNPGSSKPSLCSTIKQ